MTLHEWECLWAQGDIDRQGQDTKGTEYDNIVDKIKYKKFEAIDSAYLGDSPVGDPWEYYRIKKNCQQQGCGQTVGGVDGSLYQIAEVWDANCPIFKA